MQQTGRLSVREIEKKDIENIISYWLTASEEYLKNMGADIKKIPDENYWTTALSRQIGSTYPEKQSYCLIWEKDRVAVGHCNINNIIFGNEAFMHLHLWKPEYRNKGIGVEFVKMCIPIFFEKMQLKKLYSEPYALNPAPNKVLEKAGFQFIKEYVTVPGAINFEQPVKRWEISADNL